jgi:putative transcriptional regulator
MKNRLRVLRAEKDWTQAQLAEIVGVSRHAVIAVENGKYDPALPLAFKLARAFGKTWKKCLSGKMVRFKKDEEFLPRRSLT